MYIAFNDYTNTHITRHSDTRPMRDVTFQCTLLNGDRGGALLKLLIASLVSHSSPFSSFLFFSSLLFVGHFVAIYNIFIRKQSPLRNANSNPLELNFFFVRIWCRIEASEIDGPLINTTYYKLMHTDLVCNAFKRTKFTDVAALCSLWWEPIIEI